MRERAENELDAWMARLADGDRDAFDPLFRALLPRALRLARRRLPKELADDAAQSAMMKLFARASEFRAGAAALPWFYAIVANEIRAVQRRAPRSSEPIEDQPLAADGDPETALLRCELQSALDAAIGSLDRASADAIAAILGEAPGPAVRDAAFRKRVSRAYARLRVLLGGTGGS